MRKFFFGLLLLIPFMMQAQITWAPSFVSDADSVVVTFDATQGSGGLKNYTGDVYAHTGVITNLSTTGSDWKYVKPGAWGTNTADTKLTRIGTNLYTYTIKPSIRSFYGVPAGETIKQVAFVFRSSAPYTGTTYYEGKTAAGGDIYLTLTNSGLNAKITAPATLPVISPVNTLISVTAISTLSTSLTLYVDNVQVGTTTGDTIAYNYTPTTAGRKWIKAVASDGTSSKADSIPVVIRGDVVIADLPAGIVDGINYTSAVSATLCLYAPNKSYVYAMGDFSNWDILPDYYMKRTSDGLRYWTTVTLSPGTEYGFQYLVDGSINIADPYADKILDPANDKYIDATTYPNLKAYPTGKATQAVSVMQSAQSAYTWNVTSFTKPAKEKLVIYELLLRDFTTQHSFQSLIDTLSYLKTLGINAIELMPFTEFEGNLSWGYNPAFMFAPDKYYGPKNTVKKFIDVCHQNGIAVILDMVLNHQFGSSPLVRLYWDAANNRPAANSPWFNTVATHDYSVGYDFNHEATATKDFVARVCKYWITEYKIDGYRFDLSKGFTQTNTLGNTAAWGAYDQSRVNIWNRISSGIWAVDPSAYVILEHFADNSEETVLANAGMMLWGKMNYNYNEASMGWTATSDFSGVSYKNRGWNNPNLVGYMESHDEERLMYKNLMYGNVNGSYSIKTLPTALDRMKLNGAFFFTVPGPKLFEFAGELGYDTSVSRPCGTTGSCTDAKAFPWNYYSNAYRYRLYKTWAAIIKLKTTYPAFSTTDFNISFAGATKRLNLNHASMNVTIIGNFDVTTQSATPNFQSTGTWYDYLTGDSISVSNTTAGISLNAGDFKIYTSVRLPKPDLGPLTDVEQEQAMGVPTSYLLKQNYPNPFNPATVIAYQLPEAAKVNITVYDILGNQVAQLVNEHREAGYYSTPFNASNFASGVYIARLNASTSSKVISQSIKMILTK